MLAPCQTLNMEAMVLDPLYPDQRTTLHEEETKMGLTSPQVKPLEEVQGVQPVPVNEGPDWDKSGPRAASRRRN